MTTVAEKVLVDALDMKRVLNSAFGLRPTSPRMLGMCDGVILHVTYTERGEHIRLISARRAEKHEQDDYDRENSI
jgi:uncharacterized DUF497 family protein